MNFLQAILGAGVLAFSALFLVFLDTLYQKYVKKIPDSPAAPVVLTEEKKARDAEAMADAQAKMDREKEQADALREYRAKEAAETKDLTDKVPVLEDDPDKLNEILHQVGKETRGG